MIFTRWTRAIYSFKLMRHEFAEKILFSAKKDIFSNIRAFFGQQKPRLKWTVIDQSRRSERLQKWTLLKSKSQRLFNRSKLVHESWTMTVHFDANYPRVWLQTVHWGTSLLSVDRPLWSWITWSNKITWFLWILNSGNIYGIEPISVYTGFLLYFHIPGDIHNSKNELLWMRALFTKVFFLFLRST